MKKVVLPLIALVLVSGLVLAYETLTFTQISNNGVASSYADAVGVGGSVSIAEVSTAGAVDYVTCNPNCGLPNGILPAPLGSAAAGTTISYDSASGSYVIGYVNTGAAGQIQVYYGGVAKTISPAGGAFPTIPIESAYEVNFGSTTAFAFEDGGDLSFSECAAAGACSAAEDTKVDADTALDMTFTNIDDADEVVVVGADSVDGLKLNRFTGGMWQTARTIDASTAITNVSLGYTYDNDISVFGVYAKAGDLYGFYHNWADNTTHTYQLIDGAAVDMSNDALTVDVINGVPYIYGVVEVDGTNYYLRLHTDESPPNSRYIWEIDTLALAGLGAGSKPLALDLGATGSALAIILDSDSTVDYATMTTGGSKLVYSGAINSVTCATTGAVANGGYTDDSDSEVCTAKRGDGTAIIQFTADPHVGITSLNSGGYAESGERMYFNLNDHSLGVRQGGSNVVLSFPSTGDVLLCNEKFSDTADIDGCGAANKTTVASADVQAVMTNAGSVFQLKRAAGLASAQAQAGQFIDAGFNGNYTTGTTTPGTGGQTTCAAQGGETCASHELCYSVNNFVVKSLSSASDTANCCIGYCGSKPDLHVKTITAGSNILNQGASTLLTASIENDTPLSAGAFTAELRLGSETGTVLESKSVTGVSPKGSKDVQFTFDSSNHIGLQTLYIVLDTTSAVDELDETNNAGSYLVLVRGNQEVCGNASDDDGDGLIDEGCIEYCGDQTDNDNDGLVDEGCRAEITPQAIGVVFT